MLTTQQKLEILADAAKYDASCSSSGAREAELARRRPRLDHRLRHLPLLHAGRPLRVAAENPAHQRLHVRLQLLHQPPLQQRPARAFTVEEVVSLTLNFYKRNYIEGLFLSSGIIGSPDYTMEQIVRVARSLREEHGFRGYIHLKTIPEADADLIAEAGRYADRVSINVELPTEKADRVCAGEAGLVDPQDDGGDAAADRRDESREESAALRAGRPEHADDRRRRWRDRRDHHRHQRDAVRQLQSQAHLLLRVQPDPRCQQRAAGEGRAACARASALSGRLAVPLLWLRGE